MILGIWVCLRYCFTPCTACSTSKTIPGPGLHNLSCACSILSLDPGPEGLLNFQGSLKRTHIIHNMLYGSYIIFHFIRLLPVASVIMMSKSVCVCVCVYIYMALIYLIRPWTLTNAENFQTSRVNYISKISKNYPIKHIHVKSVYSTPQC